VQPEATPTDPQASWQIEALAWFETHKRQLVYVGAAALAVWLAAYTYKYVRAGKEAEANAALAALSRPADKSGKAAQPAAADYLKVAEQHAGTPAGARALLFAADRLFSEGKPAEAKARFEKFLSGNAGSSLAPVALMGVAACQESAGELDKAIATCEQVNSQHSGSPEAHQAKLALGLLQEQKNNPEQALRLYDEVLRAKPVTVWRMEAEMRRDQLLQKHPRLAPGGSPVAPALVAPATNAPAKK
jgi:predicted negative regulator of RcsB-dependent stress response